MGFVKVVELLTTKTLPTMAKKSIAQKTTPKRVTVKKVAVKKSAAKAKPIASITDVPKKKVAVKKSAAKAMPKAPKVVAPNNRKVSAIKRAINGYISTKKGRSDVFVNPANWYVGVTNNAHIRKVQHQKQKNIKALYFNSWNAESLADALIIEKYFHDMGMRDKDTTGGVRENTIYVYVFKINTTMLDEVAYLLGIVE